MTCATAAPQFFDFAFPTQQFNPKTGQVEFVPAARGAPAPAPRAPAPATFSSPSVGRAISNTPNKVTSFDKPEAVVRFNAAFNPNQDRSTRLAQVEIVQNDSNYLKVYRKLNLSLKFIKN